MFASSNTSMEVPEDQEHVLQALQSLDDIQSHNQGTNVASALSASNGNEITEVQIGSEVNPDGGSGEPSSPTNSKKRKKRDSSGAPRRRKSSNSAYYAHQSQQLPFLIVPVTVPSTNSNGPPSLSTAVANINPGGIVYPQSNMGSPFGTILYKPNYPNPISSQIPPEQEQYQQFLQTQTQYLDTIRLIREAHAARMQTSSSSPAVVAGNSATLSANVVDVTDQSTDANQSVNSSGSANSPMMISNMNNIGTLPSITSMTNISNIPSMQPLRTMPGRFTLQEQPNPRQRKSYKNENRYLLPNPLTICLREISPEEQLPMFIDGKATVQLVTASGEELPTQKSNILECPEGGLTQPFDNSTKARFSLKVSDTSEGGMFRLLFVVTYRVEGLVGTCEEKILSSPFQVSANIKKNSRGYLSADLPIVYDMKPKEGLAATETEVWIKGAGFTDRVMVAFGDKMGKIIEATENLITVMAPARPDFVTGTTVSVVVSNKLASDILSAEKLLAFVYL